MMGTGPNDLKTLIVGLILHYYLNICLFVMFFDVCNENYVIQYDIFCAIEHSFVDIFTVCG